MANLNLNKVVLCGHLSTDVEVKKTSSDLSVANFNIAIARKGVKDTTDFIRCSAWRGTAEFIAKYFHKGSSIAVTGSIQVKTWEKDGVKRSDVEVVVDEAYFVDSKSDQKEEFTPAPDESLPF